MGKFHMSSIVGLSVLLFCHTSCRTFPNQATKAKNIEIPKGTSVSVVVSKAWISKAVSYPTVTAASRIVLKGATGSQSHLPAKEFRLDFKPSWSPQNYVSASYDPAWNRVNVSLHDAQLPNFLELVSLGQRFELSIERDQRGNSTLRTTQIAAHLR